MKQPPPDRFDDHDPDDDEMLALLGLQGRPIGSAAAGCPAFEELQAAAAGALPEDDARAVAAHAQGCASCRALTAASRDWEGPALDPAALRRMAARAGLAPRASSRWPWLLPLAAALVVAVLTPSLLRERVRPRPSASPTAAPSSPAFVLPLDKLDRRSPPPLTVRGEGAFEREMSAALVPYEAGDLSVAAERLEVLARRYPDAAGPRLYLGVVYLLSERPLEAKRVLEEAEPLARTFWGPSVRWYLAVARERSGGDATVLLRALCAADGEYRARACAALDTLARRPSEP
jgi:hypothetical protein